MQHAFKTVVQWGDCDEQGIVFYPRYFFWMDCAFHGLLRSTGFNQRKLRERFGILGTPLVTATATFAASVSYDQELNVEAAIVRWGSSSFEIAYRGLSDGLKIFEGNETRVWLMPGQGKPQGGPIPEEFRSGFIGASRGTATCKMTNWRGQMLDLRLPKSKADVDRVQSERKPIALRNAKRAPFYRGKLDHIREDRLDDPEEWSKIPIIDKETLRAIGPKFAEQVNIAKPNEIAEYWRSGGATGVPLFYPRTFTDMDYAYLQLARCWACAGAGEGDLCHMSFPLGVHPAGQLWSRTANLIGVGIIWVGSGAATPSQTQLELIQQLKPTIWMGMPSYGLHLANLAEAQGIDLAKSSVRKVLVGAEALSKAKREKLERMWGAEVNDLFGMTEIGILGSDAAAHEGFHIWTDQAIFEVVDEKTGLPVAEGQPGLMVITPLWLNNATPFLRWSSGDIVSIHQATGNSGPFSVFPVMRHAHRTAGFFKIRGININHTEFEDFAFRIVEINDFKVELRTEQDREVLKLLIEVKRGIESAAAAAAAAEKVRAQFEVRPVVEVLPTGTLAKEFESAVKAPRFVDLRN
jgi:phenylacetate-CoA ligase